MDTTSINLSSDKYIQHAAPVNNFRSVRNVTDIFGNHIVYDGTGGNIYANFSSDLLTNISSAPFPGSVKAI